MNLSRGDYETIWEGWGGGGDLNQLQERVCEGRGGEWKEWGGGWRWWAVGEGR